MKNLSFHTSRGRSIGRRPHYGFATVLCSMVSVQAVTGQESPSCGETWHALMLIKRRYVLQSGSFGKRELQREEEFNRPGWIRNESLVFSPKQHSMFWCCPLAGMGNVVLSCRPWYYLTFMREDPREEGLRRDSRIGMR